MDPIKIALVNEAKTPLGFAPAALAAALAKQANEHVATVWGIAPVEVYVSAKVNPGHWSLVLLDNADQADALGYHELTPDGQPQGRVFVKTTKDDGQKVTVTASHECLEMLVDPWCCIAAQAGDGTFYAYEVCDAVEDREYRIDGVAVSDFVFPDWFISGTRATKLSYLGSVKKPFTLTKGGYISVFKPKGGGWSQVFGSREAEARFNPARKKRALRRMS